MIRRSHSLVYRVRDSDGITVVDLHWEPSIIEKGDDCPIGLTTTEIINMMRDLTDILEAMTP